MAAGVDAVTGIPLDVNHESNKYPGITFRWEHNRVFKDTDQTDALFTVVLSGNFQHDGDPEAWITVMRSSGCTNKWKIDVNVSRGTAPSTTITCRMLYSHDPRFATLNTKMRVYKAAVELENFLLTKLIPLATSQFEIVVSAIPLAEFHNILEESSDSNEDDTSEWLNMQTMDRVYTWITTVVPTFVRCWMSDVKVEEMEAYDASSGKSIKGKQSLLSDKNNVLTVVSAPRGLVPPTVGKKSDLAGLDSTLDAIRHPCKIQVVLTPEHPVVFPKQTLRHTPLMDITPALALQHSVYVRSTLFHGIDIVGNGKSRVFCVFPSFDEFPGLLSDDGRFNAWGSLHCNTDHTDEHGVRVGPPTVFKTSGIVQCPGEALVRTTEETCQPSGNVFRIRKSHCDERRYQHSNSDPTCCIYPFSLGDPFVSEMRIYGNRTVDRSREFTYLLVDAYEWFEREIGTEGPITVFNWSESEFEESYRLFRHFMPNCSTLRISAGNADEMARAMEFMTFATEHDLVYNAILHISVEKFPRIADLIPLFQKFPKNRTEIYAGPIGGVLPFPMILSLDKWISTLESRQVDVMYSFEGNARVSTSESANIHLTRFSKVWTMMLSQGYRRVGPTTTTEVIQMRRDHVQLTIDWTVSSTLYWKTTLRYVAGARYTPRAMTRPSV